MNTDAALLLLNSAHTCSAYALIRKLNQCPHGVVTTPSVGLLSVLEWEDAGVVPMGFLSIGSFGVGKWRGEWT